MEAEVFRKYGQTFWIPKQQSNSVAIVLSAPAENDIESILRYTLSTWGKDQFENYFKMIQDTLSEIENNPKCLTCRQRKDLFAGCYSKSFGKHIVFYRIDNSRVEVIRILHQMMDHSSHF